MSRDPSTARRLAELVVRRLRGCHAVERRWSALIELGDAAVPALERELAGEERMRTWAAVVLHRIDTDGARRSLARAIGDSLADVRLFAAVALARLGDPRALAPLLELAAGGAPWMKWDAFAALGELGDARAVPILAAAARAPDWNTCARAALALERLGTDGSAALAAILRSGGPEQRSTAAHSLGRAGDRAALPALAAAVADPEPYVRAAAVSALVRLDRDAGAGAARAALSDPEATVRRSACDALGASAGHADWLAPLLSDPDPDVRRAAASGLGKLDHPGVEAWLLPLLATGDEWLVEAAVAGLARTGGAASIHALEALLPRLHRVARGKQRRRLRRAILHALVAIRARLRSQRPLVG